MTNTIRRRLLLAAALSSSLLASAALVAQDQGGSVSPAFRAVLDQAREDTIRSISDGNPDALLARTSENIRLMPAYQMTVVGKANAASYHRAFAARFAVTRYTRELIETLDLGLRVVEIGRFTMNLAPRNKAGEPRELVGKYLELWEKSDGDALTLITSGWNCDRWIEFADVLKFAEVPAVNVALAAHLPVKDPISFELAALNMLMEAAVSQHDASLWSQFYANDAFVLNNQSPASRGRREIDAYLVEHARQLPVFEHLDIRNDRIDDLGRYVIEYASHVANWRNGDSSGVGTGKDFRIWRREPGGSLKIWRHIGMYD